MKKKPEEVVEFYNKRGTAELYIKEGKRTFNWTRLSCKRFRDNQARLQLHALAYNLTAILRNIELPEEMKKWSLSTIQLKLIKVGARVVRHARAITFQLAEPREIGLMNSNLKATPCPHRSEAMQALATSNSVTLPRRTVHARHQSARVALADKARAQKNS